MADRRLRRMMTGKIHRATVTGADLHYVGSVTVDADLLDADGVYRRLWNAQDTATAGGLP
mgnify:FL=1